MPDHKTNFNKLKKKVIIASIFSNHNDMRLEINYKKKKNCKKYKHVEAKQYATNQRMGH